MKMLEALIVLTLFASVVGCATTTAPKVSFVAMADAQKSSEVVSPEIDLSSSASQMLAKTQEAKLFAQQYAYTDPDSIFATFQECKEAVESGVAKNYIPSNTSGAEAALAEYKKGKLFLMISDTWSCPLMDVPGKLDRHVALQPGTKFWVKEKGSEKPYKLVACGNEIKGDTEFLVVRKKTKPATPSNVATTVVAPPPSLPNGCFRGSYGEVLCPVSRPVAKKGLCKLSGWHTAGCIVGGMIVAGLLYNALDDDDGPNGPGVDTLPPGPGVDTGGVGPGVGTIPTGPGVNSGP